jgi:enoyl-CoA hydratase/carnithine racemase
MELKWGLIPDMSSTQLMRHHVPEDAVRELTYTARMFDSEEAKEYNFVTKVVDDPVAHALEVAAVIANRNPHAVQASKRVLNQANYVSAAEGLLMESVEQDQIIGQPNQIEAVMAELQKRPPKFTD